MKINENILTAEEGMFLVNESQKVVGVEVILGRYDSIENWRELSANEKEQLETKWLEELYYQ